MIRSLLTAFVMTVVLLPAGATAQQAAPEPSRAPEEPSRAVQEPSRAPEESSEAVQEPSRAPEEQSRAVQEPSRASAAEAPSARDEQSPARDEQSPARGEQSSARPAADGASDDVDTSLERFRSPVDVLNERMVGTASRAVRFDWRKTRFGVAAQFSELLERNNFGSTRLGGHVRKPFGNLVGELGLNYVFVWGSDSTEKLALTPYRQAGRPRRLELDVNVAFPLAEGVATAWPGFFPATELVFSAIGGLRYAYYPGAFKGAKATEVGKSLFALQLSERELENLERRRPGGMQVDPARYGLLVGLSLDVYFQTGGFLSPRAMIALPIFALADDASRLGAWWELSIAAGWAF